MLRAIAGPESWSKFANFALKDGVAKFQTWSKGKEFRFPSSEKDHPFRITFAFSMSGGRGDIVPLQQCVETRFETADRLDRAHWARDPSELCRHVGKHSGVDLFGQSQARL